MRGCDRAFAADTAGAMHDEWFFRRDRELDAKVAVRCMEGLRAGSGQWRFRAPAIDPDIEPITRRTGFAQTGPAHFLRIVKTALTKIAHGEMGQVQVSDGPLLRQGLRLLARHATA